MNLICAMMAYAGEQPVLAEGGPSPSAPTRAAASAGAQQSGAQGQAMRGSMALFLQVGAQATSCALPRICLLFSPEQAYVW